MSGPQHGHGPQNSRGSETGRGSENSRPNVIRTLYGWVMALASGLLRHKLTRRGRAEPGYLVAMDERFGHYDHAPESGAACVWLHAVSLGETRAAAVLITALRARLPGMRLLLTHGTATGREAGAALLRPGDLQVWQPWDAPGPVARFLDQFQPRIGLLMETEIWPTLTAACQARGLPLLLVNARLSAQTLRSSQRLAWLARPAYRALHAVYAQTEDDAQRLRQLGAPVRGVLGNLKFDAQPDPSMLALGQRWRAALAATPGQGSPSRFRPVIMLASSREGEEALLLDLLAGIAQTTQGTQAASVQWLVVPRHPQRFDEVVALAQARGFTVSRRSAWGDGLPPVVGDGVVPLDPTAPGIASLPTLWIGDSLGEMPAYFALSDVALLGGSFLPFGGQNLIEAAACACPVVMGPHTYNFAEAAQSSIEAGAALAVSDLASGVRVAFELVQKEERRMQYKRAGMAFVAEHSGATGRTADAVIAELGAI
jgi:3-deoxy-D-manno-octulosonic-acid transferase